MSTQSGERRRLRTIDLVEHDKGAIRRKINRLCATQPTPRACNYRDLAIQFMHQNLLFKAAR